MKRGNGMPGYVIHLAVANEYMRKNNEDIKDKTQCSNFIKEIKANSKYPLFLSIDQEGGRVERTENIYGG